MKRDPDVESWQCQRCSAWGDFITGEWRYVGGGYEHKCPDADPQVGHFPARWIPRAELVAQLAAVTADRDAARVCLDLVSGALMDAGVVVPEDAEKYSDAVRAIAAERDEARRGDVRRWCDENKDEAVKIIADTNRELEADRDSLRQRLAESERKRWCGSNDLTRCNGRTANEPEDAEERDCSPPCAPSTPPTKAWPCPRCGALSAHSECNRNPCSCGCHDLAPTKETP